MSGVNMDKKIFLTGGSGFLGKHIQANFAKNYNFLALARKELDLKNTEAVNAYLEKIEGLDYILNAANVGGTRNSVKSEQDCLYENIIAFRNIFEHRNAVKRFIQFGSGAEYSKPFHKRNVSEEDAGENLPADAYGLSKFFAGQTLENLGRVGQHVNLRIFGIFGPYEDYQVRFISNAIVRSLFDLPIIVNQNAEFDYLYIKDFLKIINYFIENPAPYHSYNITSGISITLIELAEIVKEMTGNKHDIIIKNSIVNQSYTGSNKRLKEFLPQDFQFMSIKHSVNDLMSWYVANLDSLDVSRVKVSI
jgi:UDP-glucose 4-epimerase